MGKSSPLLVFKAHVGGEGRCARFSLAFITVTRGQFLLVVSSWPSIGRHQRGHSYKAVAYLASLQQGGGRRQRGGERERGLGKSMVAVETSSENFSISNSKELRAGRNSWSN
jgi:hypothetical protein